MKLTAYSKILKMGKEAVQASMAPIRSREMRKKAELEQCQIESKIVEAEQKIQDICSGYPIDFDGLILQVDKKALLERRLKQYGEIIDQMFPE